MATQTIILWTGGDDRTAKEDSRKSKDIPVLPRPAPLQQSAHVTFQWGRATFDFLATSCTVRTAPWDGHDIPWLHCLAIQLQLVKWDESNSTMSILVPADYVIRIQPAASFRITRSRRSGDIGLFPPHFPAPANRLPLPDIERAVAALLSVERN